MTELSKLKSTTIPASQAALTTDEINHLLKQLNNWQISPENGQLVKRFEFKNYYETIAFVNAIAWIAHQEDHHPDLKVSYNHCTVGYNTHTVKGLSKNDFICAAKIDQLK